MHKCGCKRSECDSKQKLCHCVKKGSGCMMHWKSIGCKSVQSIQTETVIPHEDFSDASRESWSIVSDIDEVIIDSDWPMFSYLDEDEYTDF